MVRLISLLIPILCLCRALAFAQVEIPGTFPSEIPDTTELFPKSFAGINGAQIDFTPPSSKKIFTLEFGPKLVELKATYFEKHLEEPLLLGSLSDQRNLERWGKYADLLAVSSQFGGKLIAEAEAAYSTLGFPASSDQLPMMTRLEVRGRWGNAGYGVSNRSAGAGYVSPAESRSTRRVKKGKSGRTMT